MKKIKRIYTRYYSDNGQKMLYVEWVDGGRTECDAEKAGTSTHMRALVDRATREGLRIEHEVW